MSNTTDQAFKKTEQVVERPGVTDHDIHEDYMRNPPNVSYLPIPVYVDKQANGI